MEECVLVFSSEKPVIPELSRANEFFFEKKWIVV